MTTVSWQLKLGVDGVDEVNKANKALKDAKKAAEETEKAVKTASSPVRGPGGRFLPKGGAAAPAASAPAAAAAAVKVPAQAATEAAKAVSGLEAALAAGQIFYDSAGKLRDKSGRFLSAGEKEALGVPMPQAAPEAPKSLEELEAAANEAFKALKDCDKAFQHLRKSAASSGAATDLEKGLNSMIPTALQSGAAPRQLGAFSKALQAISGGVSKVFGARAGASASRGIIGMAEGLSKLEPYMPMIGAVAKGAATVYLAAAGAALMGTAAVVQAQSFKEDSLGALKTLLRSNQLADQAFQTAVKTADFLGRGRQETVGQFVDLLAKGFDVKKVDEIVKSMADLATVDPKANMDAIVRAIGQIKGTGRLQGDELLQLADAGLETSAVYEQLAQILGKSVPDVQKQISAGKVDADTAITAILQAINSQAGGGKAGAAAAAKSMQSISGLLRRLENVPGNLLMGLDVNPGMDRVRSFLKELVGFFDMNSESGKELSAVLSETFNEFVGGLLGEDPAATVKDSVKSLTETIKDLNKSGKMREFGQSLRDLGELAAIIVQLTGYLSSLTASSSEAGETFGVLGSIVAKSPFGMMVSAIASLVGWLLELVGVDVSGFTDWLSSIGSMVSESVSAFGTEALNVGTAIVDGIKTGILNGAQGVLDAITGVAGGAIQAAKNMLGIASPSKVFAEIGNFTAEGFAVGVSSNDNAQGALADMTAAPDAGGGPALRIGGRGGPLIGGDLNIRVDGRGQDDERLARLIAAEVQRTLENIAIQLGAVAPEAA